MKKLLLVTLLLPVLMMAQMRGPKIKAASDLYDFGEVEQGAVVKYNFLITNDGDDTLTILGVNTSCGCTAADLKQKSIKPGETAPLAVEFNTKDRIGPQIKYISITSNDAGKPVLKLTISGKIIMSSEQSQKVVSGPKLKFIKEQFDFGVVSEGKIVDYTFEYMNEGTETLEIKDVKTSCGCTAAVVNGKSLKPGEKGTLRVELDTTNRVGRISRNVTVSSNDMVNGQKILTIYAEIVKKAGN